MSAHQFEATKDLLKTANKSATWKHNKEQSSHMQQTLKKSDISSCFIVSSGHWTIFKNFGKQVYYSIMLVLSIPVFICTLFVQVTTKNFPRGTLLAHFPGRRPLGKSLTHDD